MADIELRTTDFDYVLPPELIAQTAAEPRDSSRLLVLNRAAQSITHCPRFSEITDYLQAGDTLVVNESKVLPARLFGKKESGGQIELLFLHPVNNEQVWEVLVRPGRGTKPGARFEFGGNHINKRDLEVASIGSEDVGGSSTTDNAVLKAEVLEIAASGGRVVRFNQNPVPFLEQYGQMPLPPYIHQQPENPNRYQTVYANPVLTGSAAAPTAGLHFTDALIAKIKAMGVNFEKVTLHVGLDTFQPVKEENALDHHMHSEWCHLSAEVAARLNHTHTNGGRIIAVGTTTVRTLETAYAGGGFAEFAGQTRLFLYPGKELKAVDALITNFHLPRSTLLMLVSAFAGREFILKAYNEAVAQRYRFFSFGDAMLIL